MEFKQIKELMGAMGRTGVTKISIKREGFELELEREQYSMMSSPIDMEDEAMMREGALHRAALAVPNRVETSPLGGTPAPTQAKAEIPGTYITSPMVGTFYASPSPDDPSFVKPGDKIEKNTVVCIVEAMKVMNEVKSGISGTIIEILVEPGQPVEFGTKLFKVN